MLFRLIIIQLFVLQSLSLYSQGMGRLPYKNFSHKDYSGHFQNWAVATDHRGVIYIGNNTSGVLEYDGSDWNNIPITNGIARCLDVDSYGRIWVGGQDEYGYIAPDSIGLMKYFSLSHLIPNSCLPIGLVRQVFATDNGIYFSTNNCIFNIKADSVIHWMPKTFFHRTYNVNGNIFSIQPDVGLTVLKADTFTIAPKGEFFANIRIYSMIPYDKDRILIATQSNGFFLYNISSLDSELNEDKILEPFRTNADDFFNENWIYHGISLPNGWFAFGTYRGGAAIIDRDGIVQQYIGKNQGIQDESVWHIGIDNQDNIWLALNNGIAYSALISPITSWETSDGVQGVIQSVSRVNETLYISTNTGIFYLDDGSFNRLDGIVDLSWDITTVKTSDGKTHGLVGTGTGIYNFHNEKANLIINGKEPTFRILQSKYHKDIVFLGLYDGVGVAAYKNGKWTFIGRFKGVADRVNSIIEDDESNLWFVSPEKGIVRTKISDPLGLTFDSIHEQTDITRSFRFDDDSQLSLVNGKVMLSSPVGLFAYNNNNQIFTSDYSLGTEFGDGTKGIKIFLLDKFGNLWFESYSKTHIRKIERAFLNDEGTYTRLPSELNAIPNMIFYDVHTDVEGVTWIAGSDGIYRIDPRVNKHGVKIPRVLLRKVQLGKNELLFGGTFRKKCPDEYFYCSSLLQNAEEIPILPYSSNQISFHFASPFFGQEERMKYSSKLEGYDTDWSEWSSVKHKEYTNLPYGSYTFQVKVLSVYDVESPVTTFSFVIERPWFNSPLIYIAYFVILASIIVVSVRIKTRMLKASNLKLQSLVNVRTSEILTQQQHIIDKNEELTQQKEEIEAQRDELEFQNMQTKASIQYALTIQQAILPEKRTLNNFFENFILFYPKDVVSGDFYWFSHLPSKDGEFEKLFIAVVDCTGHGVPGAFMSMIGSRMLSEIINERRIHDPATVLTELDKMLKIVLHQDSSENFDGMDVCLCSIDQITKGHYLVSFSGANRPLAYNKVGASGITLLKGNRKSIGGVLPDIDPFFETQLIDFNSGDSLFLFSDGFTDQNNEFGKKFTSTRLNSLLNSNIQRPMVQIGNVLTRALHSFMGNVPQRDDITLLGIRLE